MTDLSELREKAVLPLVWEQERVGSAHMWASTPTGKYTINVYAGMPKQAFQLNHNHGPASYFDTEQEAKASAQADYAKRILSALSLPTQEPAHPDDLAVDRFASTMKVKLAKKRAEGRRGWERKDECTAEFLSQLLREHVEKGDPVDVGNLAMMLQQRGERITK